MHWSEEIAQRIIERKPDKEEYVCAAGTSPSGSIHIGNFRDIATSYFVVRALQKMGKKAKLLLSWDEYDRFRKVPKNIAEFDADMEQYVGMPYTSIRDPYGCCESYAAHFEKEYEQALAKFGIPLDLRYQTAEYQSGRYVPYILTALEKRRQIYDILCQFRTQPATEEEREAYYPVNIFCPKCGKDSTKIHSISEDCTKAHYSCKCGYEGDFDFTKDFHCKLAWKIDWPMRWLVEGVDFEPGGKDHASPMGSYQVGRLISKEIYDYEAPIFQAYEFIGIKGMTGKMSGSSGMNLTPDTLLNIYQPEVILWLYSKTDPTKAFDFCFDEEILRQYFEFDKAYNEYQSGQAGDYLAGIMYNVSVGDRKLKTVPMQQLASFGSIVDFNPKMLETIFAKIGAPYQEADFAERLGLAKYWMEQCSPDSMNRLLTEKNQAYYDTLDADAKACVKLLHDYLAAGGYTLDELEAYLYEIPKQIYGELDDKAKKKVQGQFFKDVYSLLIGKQKGPRLYLFLYAVNVADYLPLLDF